MNLNFGCRRTNWSFFQCLKYWLTDKSCLTQNILSVSKYVLVKHHLVPKPQVFPSNPPSSNYINSLIENISMLFSSPSLLDICSSLLCHCLCVSSLSSHAFRSSVFSAVKEKILICYYPSSKAITQAAYCNYF